MIQGVKKKLPGRTFFVINTDDVDSKDDRFKAAHITKTGCKCCRKMVVSRDKKHELQESRKKLVERFYCHQQYDENQEIATYIIFTGVDSGPHGEIISHSNVWFDKYLGVRTCASRRITCLCEACKIQLDKP